MSTHYSVNRVTLSNNERINTNFNDFMNENKDWLKEEITENTTKTYRCVFDGSSYGWFDLDENENIQSVWRYGGNYIKEILDSLDGFLSNQIDTETYQNYKNDVGIDIFRYTIISEYNFDSLEFEIKKLGKEVWNKIFTDYEWDKMLNDDLGRILDCFWSELMIYENEETLKHSTLNTLINKHSKTMFPYIDDDFIIKNLKHYNEVKEEILPKINKLKESLNSETPITS